MMKLVQSFVASLFVTSCPSLLSNSATVPYLIICRFATYWNHLHNKRSDCMYVWMQA